MQKKCPPLLMGVIIAISVQAQVIRGSSKCDLSTLSSNNEIRRYYCQLVEADSICYAISGDSLVRVQMSRHYNSLAWYSILTSRLDQVEYDLRQSIKYDSLSPYPYSNLPLYFLLTHRYKIAKKLYLAYKDRPFVNNRTFKDEFLTDLQELKKVGIKSHRIKKIARILTGKGK